MRENFDFVSMANYKADMDELGDRAAAVSQIQAEEIRNLKRLVWAMAKAAGGRVRVYDGILNDWRTDAELTFSRCEADSTFIIEAT